MKPITLDSLYFSTRAWRSRLKDALSRWKTKGSVEPFLRGHLAVIRKLLLDADTGPRMVINIGADALLSFLATGLYKNIYERPVVGGAPRTPTSERLQVDAWLALPDPAAFYFGAIALGGAGVRYYGEYCMAIRRSSIPADTRLFDRDSYDLLEAPLTGGSPARMLRIVKALRGTWSADLVDMLILKMLPRLPETHHLITSGSVSALVMNDQEFVEVHLPRRIDLQDIEEIRQLPHESSIEASIIGRRRGRLAPTLVEIRWLAQRRKVLRGLAHESLAYRLVTMDGKGYQWT
jgi:hypothetical protein